ncbi:Hypothetical protein (plasmid) [Pseudomonas putida]|nr:Hypothetical protein [Pseudomonas putida]
MKSQGFCHTHPTLKLSNLAAQPGWLTAHHSGREINCPGICDNCA